MSEKRRAGDRANRFAREAMGRVDGQTEEFARGVAGALHGAGRLLDKPTLILGLVPVPFIALIALVALQADGFGRLLCGVIAGVMALVCGLYHLRRRRILAAVAHREQLQTELALLVAMSPKADETRHVLTQVAGGGGARVFSRLRGAWRGVSMPADWIVGVDDLPLAKWFAPPRLGTTVTLAVAALWLVPLSILAAFFVGIGALAGSL